MPDLILLCGTSAATPTDFLNPWNHSDQIKPYCAQIVFADVRRRSSQAEIGNNDGYPAGMHAWHDDGNSLLRGSATMIHECFSKGIVLAFALLLSACVNYGSVDGVDNLWRDVPLERFQEGVTSQSEVLEVLGPPSQLINLDNQVVFYYLAQQNEGRGKAFIVWNQLSEERRYDRAIFFFDTEGVLQEVAYSKETIPR